MLITVSEGRIEGIAGAIECNIMSVILIMFAASTVAKSSHAAIIDVIGYVVNQCLYGVE